MKKKVFLVLLVSMLMTGVASAAGMWGTYNGNDIVRLTVDGVPVKVSDVPAINYNDRTMVPIYLLKQAGVSYTWDQKNKTVDVKKSVTSDSVSEYDILYLKDLAFVADYYNRLNSLGSLIAGLSTDLSLSFQAKQLDKGNETLQTTLERLNYAIDAYNEFLEFSDVVASEVKRNNLNVSDGDTALNNYYDAIEYYKKSYEAMERFYSNSSDSNFNAYLNNASSGYDEIAKGRTLAMNNYFKYMDLIQNY